MNAERNSATPWRPVVDRLDTNAQLLRAILTAIQEIPSVGGNTGGGTVAVGGSANIPVPLPIVASSTIPTTIDGQPISVKFDNPQQVSVSNTPIGTTVQPARTRYFAPISATAVGTTTVVNGASGQKIRVVAFGLTSSLGTITIKFKSGTTTDLTGPMTVQSPLFAALPDGGLFETDTGASLTIELSAAAVVGGFVVYERI